MEPFYDVHSHERMLSLMFPTLFLTRDGSDRRSLMGCERSPEGDGLRQLTDSFMLMFSPDPGPDGWMDHAVQSGGDLLWASRLVPRHDGEGLAYNRSGLDRRGTWHHHIRGTSPSLSGDRQIHPAWSGALRDRLFLDVDVRIGGDEPDLYRCDRETRRAVIRPWIEAMDRLSMRIGIELPHLIMLTGGGGFWIQMWFAGPGTIGDGRAFVGALMDRMLDSDSVRRDGSSLTDGAGIRWTMDDGNLSGRACRIPWTRNLSNPVNVSVHLDPETGDPDPMRFVGFSAVPVSLGVAAEKVSQCRPDTPGRAVAPSVPPHSDGITEIPNILTPQTPQETPNEPAANPVLFPGLIVTSTGVETSESITRKSNRPAEGDGWRELVARDVPSGHRNEVLGRSILSACWAMWRERGSVVVGEMESEIRSRNPELSWTDGELRYQILRCVARISKRIGSGSGRDSRAVDIPGGRWCVLVSDLDGSIVGLAETVSGEAGISNRTTIRVLSALIHLGWSDGRPATTLEDLARMVGVIEPMEVDDRRVGRAKKRISRSIGSLRQVGLIWRAAVGCVDHRTPSVYHLRFELVPGQPVPECEGEEAASYRRAAGELDVDWIITGSENGREC